MEALDFFSSSIIVGGAAIALYEKSKPGKPSRGGDLSADEELAGTQVMQAKRPVCKPGLQDV